MISFDEIFQGRSTPAWLRGFQLDPFKSLHDLLIGRADLGSLGADEPVSVLTDWLNLFSNQNGFSSLVDQALTNWIEYAWHKPLLELTTNSSALTSIAWCRACNLIATNNSLEHSAITLKSKVSDGTHFLDGLRQGRSRDPEGRAWLALSKYQKDRSLLDEWWNLCKLPPTEPWYRGVYGIHGLRGLPSTDPINEGRVPREVAGGLIALASALYNRYRHGWIQEHIARNEFLQITRITIAAYPIPIFWRTFLSTAQEQLPKGVYPWLDAIFRRGGERIVPFGTQYKVQAETPNPTSWRAKGQEIANRLLTGDPSAFTEAEQLLREEVYYAEETGAVRHAVLSANNFASKVRYTQPELALRWLNISHRLDNWNSYTWNITTTTLISLARNKEALQIATETVQRFPENPVSRNLLAEALRSNNRLHAAESIYAEAAELFGNHYAWNGLATVIASRGRLDEAANIYKKTSELFPRDVASRTALGNIFWREGKIQEAEQLFRQVLEIDPRNKAARLSLKYLLIGQNSLSEAALFEADEETPNDPTTRNEIARALLLQGNFVEAAAVYRETLRRFPNDTEAQIGLAEALRLIGQQGDDIEEVHFQPDDINLLLTDAYLLRRWARLVGTQASASNVGQMRETAQQMLVFLSNWGRSDSRAAGEFGLVSLISDDLKQALPILREAARVFPGSAKVHYALARLERELVLREGQTKGHSAQEAVIEPWRQLGRANELLLPLSLLGEGRAWLSIEDGYKVVQGARDAFGRLARWITRQRSDNKIKRTADEAVPLTDTTEYDTNTDDTTDSTPLSFSLWWANQIQQYIFGEQQVSRADDLKDIEPLRTMISKHNSKLNLLEEDYLYRIAAA